MCDKKICIQEGDFFFTVYIPYYMDDNVHEECYYGGTCKICEYFGLPTTRKFGELTYTNFYGDNEYEIGFICESLDDTYEKIKVIKNAIMSKGGKINDCENYIIDDCQIK